MASLILIHGAWHGSWCWDSVARELRGAGHEVHAPTLSGLAERFDASAGTIDLDTHISDVMNLIQGHHLTDVIVCAHSYGGMVAAGVENALPLSIRSLVFLDAFVPEDGDSIATLSGAVGSDRDLIPPPPAAWFGLSGEQASWVDSMLTSQPAKTFGQPIRLSGPFHCDLTYVMASDWQSLPHFKSNYLRAQTEPHWKAHAIKGSHDLMIDRPNEIASLLHQLV
jgi:pimeloyl-ACP methyl ester carboxylesterase